VRADARSAWKAYEAAAWGHDELAPRSEKGEDWYGASLLVTPVDALDTLVLLHLDAEAERARQLIDQRLSFDHDISVQLFEVTIRDLGGLLSAYEMTGDRRLLELASDLGNRVLPAFASPTGMPYRFVNLRTGEVSGARSNPAEIGSLILELGTLSRLTGEPVFLRRAKKALVALYSRRSAIGLVGDGIDVDSGKWTSPASHIGGGIDSYYEYLLKCSLLFEDAQCRSMWLTSRRAIHRYLADDGPAGLWFGVADMRTGRRTATEFGALQAFYPAVLALDGELGRARRLEDSAHRMWSLKGLEPDAIDYRTMKILDPRYPLRPEIVESAYYLHHFTHDPKYVRMGVDVLDAIEKHCRAGDAFTVVEDVTTMRLGDRMPSYFLAETLKYLYLLFSPDSTLDFDRVVFTTEAHPLRRAR